MKQKNGFIPGGTCWWGSEGGQHQQEEIHKQKSPRVKRKAVSASTPDLAIVGAFTIDSPAQALQGTMQIDYLLFLLDRALRLYRMTVIEL